MTTNDDEMHAYFEGEQGKPLERGIGSLAQSMWLRGHHLFEIKRTRYATEGHWIAPREPPLAMRYEGAKVRCSDESISRVWAAMRDAYLAEKKE